MLKKIRPIIVVFIGALYFFLDSILIVFPSALTHTLMHRYSITATGLSFLAAIYFYSYAPMQLPNGILIDRFGPKRITLIGLCLCCFSLLIFADTHNYIIACFARVLMGLGASAGYLVPMMLAVKWLDKKYYVIATGCIVLIECVGAVFGQSVLISLSHVFTLPEVISLLSFLSVVLFVLVACFVADSPTNNERSVVPRQQNPSVFINLCSIMSSKKYWLIGGCASFLWAPTAVFASLWGINFIQINNHVSSDAASHLLIAVWVGIGVGGPLIGVLTRFFNHKITLIQLFSLLGLGASLLLVYSDSSSFPMMIFYLFLMGMSCAAQVLTFGLIHDASPDNVVATALGFNNMLICFSNAVFQMLGGLLLDLFWKHLLHHGVRVYSLLTYKEMFTLMPLCYLVVIAITVSLSELPKLNLLGLMGSGFELRNSEG